jgi:hypothetical protein
MAVRSFVRPLFGLEGKLLAGVFVDGEELQVARAAPK